MAVAAAAVITDNDESDDVIFSSSWPPSEDRLPSGKGPYGQTGLYGKEEGPYESVSEDVFADSTLR